MQDYVVSGEAPFDLTPEKVAEAGIEYISGTFALDGVEHYDDLGQTVPLNEFYDAMRAGADTATSAISRGAYEEFFREKLASGHDLLHVTLSSGLSSSYDCACAAADAVRPEFPERKLFVVDSLGASSGFGLLTCEIAAKRDAGMPIEEVFEWAEANRLRMHYEFFSSDLTWYIKGGRVSPVSGFVGNMLRICPRLDMNVEGKLIPREKVRSSRKSVARIVERMGEVARDGYDYDGKVFLSNSDCPELAEQIVKLVNEKFPNIDGEVEVYSIGPTIGAHSGPGTAALYFWGEERGE